MGMRSSKFLNNIKKTGHFLHHYSNTETKMFWDPFFALTDFCSKSVLRNNAVCLRAPKKICILSIMQVKGMESTCL